MVRGRWFLTGAWNRFCVCMNGIMPWLRVVVFMYTRPLRPFTYNSLCVPEGKGGGRRGCLKPVQSAPAPRRSEMCDAHDGSRPARSGNEYGAPQLRSWSSGWAMVRGRWFLTGAWNRFCVCIKGIMPWLRVVVFMYTRPLRPSRITVFMYLKEGGVGGGVASSQFSRPRLHEDLRCVMPMMAAALAGAGISMVSPH